MNAGINFSAAIALTSFSLLTIYLLGFDPVIAVRDRALSSEPEAGIISNFGIFIMGLSGILSLVLGWIDRRGSIVLVGIFCVVFAVDDALLLHEKLGEWELAVFIIYGASLCVISAVFTLGKKQYIVWPLFFVLLAFMASGIVDVGWGKILRILGLFEWPQLRYFGTLLEDTAKLAGIVVMSSFALGEAFATRKKP